MRSWRSKASAVLSLALLAGVVVRAPLVWRNVESVRAARSLGTAPEAAEYERLCSAIHLHQTAGTSSTTAWSISALRVRVGSWPEAESFSRAEAARTGSQEALCATAAIESIRLGPGAAAREWYAVEGAATLLAEKAWLQRDSAPAAAEELGLVAAEIAPNTTSPWRTLCYVRLRRGDLTAVASVCEKALDQAKEGDEVYTWVALALDRAGDSVGGSRVLDAHGVHGYPADAVRANALRIMGRPDEAITLYRSLITTAPNDPWLYHGFALALQSTGAKQAAASAWRSALAVDAGFRPAVDGLVELGADSRP